VRRWITNLGAYVRWFWVARPSKSTDVAKGPLGRVSSTNRAFEAHGQAEASRRSEACLAVPPVSLLLLRHWRVAALLLSLGVVSALVWCSPLRLRLVSLDRFARPLDSVTVVDRHGTPLRYQRVEGIDRRWVALDDVSPQLIAAVVAAEDHRFWQHHGIDWRSLVRAMVMNGLPGSRLSGASTISQQVIKLVYRRPLGLPSKAIEVLRAVVLEELMSKREILEQYVNRVPFGDRIQGVSRASQAYFGRPVSDLTVAQAALLAGIPQAPSATEPRRHLARATRRRNVVLGRMRDTGVIDDAAYATALHEPVRIVKAPVRPYEAPRYVDRALDAWAGGRATVQDGRLKTSLDLELQRAAEGAMRRAVGDLEARGVTNGAAMVVANQSGEVMAYVAAARRGEDAAAGQMDLLRRRRQPGSTLKPFVYALLFERGGTAATLLSDVAMPMTGAVGVSFTASDYDGLQRGPVRARTALASSLNLAALDAARRVGTDAVVARFRRLSFGGVVSAEHHGAAIVLGGIDISVEELAGAYVALARGGAGIPLSIGLQGSDAAVEERLFEKQSAAVVTDILSDGRARADAFGSDLEDLAGGTFALKTGTSTGWRDAWAAVYDDRHTVVVWLGDPSGRALSEVSGFEGAAPVAARILRLARERAGSNGAEAVEHKVQRFDRVEVCGATGLLVGARCKHRIHERFVAGTAPRRRCNAHDEDGSVRLSGRYAGWVERTRPGGVSRSARFVPEGELEVVQPVRGARLFVEAGSRVSEVPLRAAVGGREVGDASWEVDGRGIDGAWWRPTPGEHNVVATLRGRRSAAAKVTVEVSSSALVE
jgi:penicillin-binding protein 1C